MDLTVLNREQRLAVETTEGPVLILAGAGSGKTRALTYRIAYLIEEKGVSPYEILALTFTNKAANEMKERVSALCGSVGEKVWISTFHSCCAKMLRMDIENISGYTRDFVIYDPTDQLSLIVEVLKELNYREEDLPKNALRALISDAKNRSLNPEQYIIEAGSSRSNKELAAFKLYEKKLRKNNALDFDDLLRRTLELFDKCPEVLDKYRNRFRYVHVDEYQDTNTAQYSFINMICSLRKNICVVGDDDQSIYGWRGADIRNILGFERDYPDTTVLRLEQNYRSTGYILDAANAVISKNTERKIKKLWTERGKGEKIGGYTAWSERDEADFICRTITNAQKSQREYGDFAVLYRTNAQSRVIEDTLVAYGIPYTVYGSLRFYDRMEIKNILAYLRLMVNPYDEVSLRRIINIPKRGIGAASIAELEKHSIENGWTLFDTCLKADQLNLTGRSKTNCVSFGQIMVQLRALSELMPLGEFVEQLLNLVDYWKYLDEWKKVDGSLDASRKENVQEFLRAVMEFQTDTEENTLSSFLENVSLVANVNDDSSTSAVTLMTLHSAKGLEFPIVFIAGMEDGIFPSSRSFYSETGMEEERRLCYVGITRAMDKLYLCNAQSRFSYEGVNRCIPSRFLKEIPPELCDQPLIPQSELGSNKETSEGQKEKSTSALSNKKELDKKRPTLGGGSITPNAPTKKNDHVFTKDQEVIHAKFGEGVIILVEGGVLTIEFAQHGIKKIVGTYAPIEPK